MPPKKQHAGSNKKLEKPNPEPTCMAKMTPFFANIDLYKKMGKDLGVDVDFLLALSSMESGWLDPHNEKLHNLFGVTKAGGNNLAYESYEAAAKHWVQLFGDHVRDSRTMEDFAEGLKKARYNSVNPDYYPHLINQLKTVRKYKAACGVQ